MNLTDSIVPRSDQANAEDFLSGPRTFTIEKVVAGTAEQPVDVHLRGALSVINHLGIMPMPAGPLLETSLP